MAYQSVWYSTKLPKKVVDLIEEDLIENFDPDFKESRLYGDIDNKDIRDSFNAWIPTTHWLSGFLWHYVMKANQENFLYDLKCIDGDNMQYTRYGEGQYYKWHSDGDLTRYYKPRTDIGVNNSDNATDSDAIKLDYVAQKVEMVRKLSFTLQLSDPNEYEGGNVLFLDENNQKYVSPRQRGTIIVFDSRTRHCVNKIKKGVRKSIVGWVVGPRWK